MKQKTFQEISDKELSEFIAKSRIMKDELKVQLHNAIREWEYRLAKKSDPRIHRGHNIEGAGGTESQESHGE